MRNKHVLIFAFTILSFIRTNISFAQEVQWASKVLGVSSQLIDSKQPQSHQLKAEQVLGKPNKLPAFGESFSAWCPAKPNGPEAEWIKVGFDKPILVEQVAIAENYHPGAVSEIIFYDINDKAYPVFKNVNVGPIGSKGRMYRFFHKTDFVVAALKIVLRTDRVPGFNQIDAIGISSSKIPIEAKINLVDSKESALDSSIKPQNLGAKINSRYQEIAPMVAPDGQTLFFTRSDHPQNTKTPNKQDVWFAEINPDGSFQNAQNIGLPINTPQHNSSFSITPDGNTMLLNNIYKANGELEKGLSMTTKTSSGKWGYPKKVIIDDFYNNNKYSEFCMSQDGKFLLMTTERNDSEGGKDIYVSFSKGDGTWAKPKNIGKTVNTAENETSPFLASDGKTLYFSTKGFSGYGSNDIFVSKRLDNTWQNWTEPQNLGPHINTPAWDAYFSISAKADYAYYTSYYKSMGDSDIFRVELPDADKPDPVALIRGNVYDKETGKPLSANIIYELLPSGANAGKALSNPEDGAYKVVLPLKQNYALLAEADGYASIDENINLTDSTEYVEIKRDLYLTALKKGATFQLKNIFFERSRFNLLPESFPELNRIIKLMKNNPNLKIRLEGHTEIFGSKRDQKKLGKNRVDRVKRYIVEEGGIDKDRIKTISFGGRFPISEERDEESRASNRRVEVRILEN